MQQLFADMLSPMHVALPMQLTSGPLDEATIAWVLRGTLGALSYLHAQASEY